MTNDCIYVDPYKKNVEATEYYFVFLHKRFLSFQAKIFQTRKQQQYFGNVNVFEYLLLCSVLLMISVWKPKTERILRKVLIIPIISITGSL